MPKTIHQSQLTVHCVAVRLYHSTASVWLSVDPLSDKYPSVSPYVYCANNPVRLVDPDGRSWETPEDEEKANQMKIQAQKEQSINLNYINKWNDELRNGNLSQNKRTRLKSAINELEARNQLLEEGIGYINQMEKHEYSFHFASVGNGADCYSAKTVSSNYQVHITIYSDDFIETRWHECIHVGDWLNTKFHDENNGVIHCFGKDLRYPGQCVLIHHNDGDRVEKHAYQSEFSFSRKRFDERSLRRASCLEDITGDHRTINN